MILKLMVLIQLLRNGDIKMVRYCISCYCASCGRKKFFYKKGYNKKRNELLYECESCEERQLVSTEKISPNIFPKNMPIYKVAIRLSSYDCSVVVLAAFSKKDAKKIIKMGMKKKFERIEILETLNAADAAYILMSQCVIPFSTNERIRKYILSPIKFKLSKFPRSNFLGLWYFKKINLLYYDKNVLFWNYDFFGIVIAVGRFRLIFGDD